MIIVLSVVVGIMLCVLIGLCTSFLKLKKRVEELEAALKQVTSLIGGLQIYAEHQNEINEQFETRIKKLEPTELWNLDKSKGNT